MTCTPNDIRRIDAVFVPERPLHLQGYAGSAWRGAYGHALKHTVCIRGLRPCEGCTVSHLCLFPKFFHDDPAAKGGAGSRYATAPAPYVLAPEPTPRGGVFEPGQPLAVQLLLIGPAAQGGAYALHALLEAGRRGIGAARVPLRCQGIARSGELPRTPDPEAIAEALQPFPLDVPPCQPAIRLAFTTPLRLRIQGDLVTGAHFTPTHLVSAAIRRREGLLGPLSAEERARLLDRARQLTWDAPRFGWVETKRRSSRQETLMAFGGIVGEATLDLSDATELWPLIWLTSILHLGKGASMGFGRLELRDV